MTPIPPYPTGTPILMRASRQWPASVHRFDDKAVAALRAAEATNRPLLIRGLPGVGKSMTARAAAEFARRPLLSQVIDSRTEADDLKARFDTVRRLADAQVPRGPGEVLPDESCYVTPQLLWWAFDWDGAMTQQRLARHSTAPRADDDVAPVPVPKEWRPNDDRAMVLIDEIDKADPELPNALLEAFGANGFTAPVTGQTIHCLPARRPLILLTTNEERELPNAFLRRCLVLWLALPQDIPALVKELVAIGTAHQQWLIELGLRKGECKVIRKAAEAVAARRHDSRDGSYQPGTSDFLDLVAALAELWPNDARAQAKQLETLQEFVLQKSGEPLA